MQNYVNPTKCSEKKACLKNFQNSSIVGEVVPKMPLQVNFKSHCGGWCPRGLRLGSSIVQTLMMRGKKLLIILWYDEIILKLLSTLLKIPTMWWVVGGRWKYWVHLPLPCACPSSPARAPQSRTSDNSSSWGLRLYHLDLSAHVCLLYMHLI